MRQLALDTVAIGRKTKATANTSVALGARTEATGAGCCCSELVRNGDGTTKLHLMV